MTIVYLDSNVYRQLGIKFKDNIDYINLSNLLETSGNEFGLLEVVLAELLDYYENDFFGTLISEHEKIIKKCQTNPYLDDIDIPSIDINLKKIIARITGDLKVKKTYSDIPIINPTVLMEFLLHNKRSNRKDNTRDFLILYTLANFCKKNKKDYIVLISQDDIFSSNEYFKNLLTRQEITNFKVFPSIIDFIKDFGPKLDFVTAEFLIQHIEQKHIEEELLKDIKCFPSYISKFYYNSSEEETPGIENLEILEVNVNDFYMVKDYKTELLNITVSLKVKINAIFEPEKNDKELEHFLNTTNDSTYSKYANSFGENYRPIFKNDILFIVEGKINEKDRTFENLVYLDFIPDYFILEELKQKRKAQTVVVVDSIICKHEMDVDNGFWKNSRFGGGLSWHYRCKKCNIEYDTGEFYD